MIEGLEKLAAMEYPGRVIIIGRNEENEDIVVYGITGRSPSSQARVLEYQIHYDGFFVRVKPTDEKTIQQGNTTLLIYDAIRSSSKKNAIIVSNGAQTDVIFQELTHGNHKSPVSCLQTALFGDWFVGNINITQYEPDAPNFTPRISGAIFNNEAAFGIITKNHDSDSAQKTYYQFLPQTGQGKFIATYTGVNQNPLPSFTESPLDVTLKGSLEGIAKHVYESLGEFKVCVAAVSNNKESYIINKNLNKGN